MNQERVCGINSLHRHTFHKPLIWTQKYIYLTPWSRALLEKLVVIQLVKNFSAFMEPEGLISCSQKPAIGPYPKAR